MSQVITERKEVESAALKAEKRTSNATTKNEALQAAIEAAELYMKALRLADTTIEKKRLDSKCNQYLKKAERIKSSREWHRSLNERSDSPTQLSSKSSSASSRVPVSSRALSKREQIILLEGSKLNGLVFPPWKGAPAAEEFEIRDGSESFVYVELNISNTFHFGFIHNGAILSNSVRDSPELRLSPLQRDIFDGWKRPSEILPIPTPRNGEIEHTKTSSSKVNLVQDVTSDCSVVASLCAGTARAERGHPRIISSIIHPYDTEASRPAKSPSGKYILRLHFNGCFRKVVIDDRLPTSKTSRSLHVINQNNPAHLWPALVEKAYLKVRGGYDFPGSNSGTDLWIITGWIPEQLFLQGEDVTPDLLWERLFRHFNDGDVLLTMGTGKLTKREQKAQGLAAEHNYAVLDLKEVNNHRLLLVKNPWSEGAVWKNHGSTDYALMVSQMAEDGITNMQHQTPLQASDNELFPGTFWMNLDSILQNFENLYLNWNPCLFQYRQDIHFTWDLSAESISPGCFASNPQFSVTSETGGTVWLLLSRHLKTGDYTTPENENDNSRYTLHKNEPGFISLYAFKAKGYRVFLSDGAIYRGSYVDSPNTLLRLEMSANDAYTIVISEQSLPRSSYNFSLSAFSENPTQISPPKSKYSRVSTIVAAWTCSTAGGNSESPDYLSNPQFSLSLSEAADIAVLLETSNPDFLAHVKVFFNNGRRVTSNRSRDIMCDSGDYRKGCALAEIQSLAKGIYTIVCSTFAARQLGKFTLQLRSTKDFTLKPLPADGAGRLKIDSSPAIFAPGTDRLLAPLTAHRLTRLTLMAKQVASKNANQKVPSSPLKLSLELGQGPYKETLASSGDGDFLETAVGVRIDDFDMRPELERQGGVWLVIERLSGPGSQIEDIVEVKALTEEPVKLGPWGTGDG